MHTRLDEIRDFFIHANRYVVTFVGYSGSGYEDEEKMLEKAGRIIKEFDQLQTIINIGATSAGIGAVYKVAKRLGFTTTGIVSTQAEKSNAALSPYVDHVFFVEDTTWGGFLSDRKNVSPTTAAMIENSNLVVGIGGGRIACDELMAAERSGKDTLFIPADRNHRRAREEAVRKGLPEPHDFRGTAGKHFSRK